MHGMHTGNGGHARLRQQEPTKGRRGFGGWWWLERCAGAGHWPGWVAGAHAMRPSSAIWRRGPDGGRYGTRPVDPVGGWVSRGLTDDLTARIVSYRRANSGCE
eukprot:scaffold33297_cov53-Phaeocystis_antarctica.AAC.5